MGATYDDDRIDDLARCRNHWTTIMLQEQADGDWLATQEGVPVEGSGATAAAAAANYCEKIDDGTDAGA